VHVLQARLFAQVVLVDRGDLDPFERRVLATAFTSVSRSRKSTVIAAIDRPVGWKFSALVTP
jgi:hypothetical protein